MRKLIFTYLLLYSIIPLMAQEQRLSVASENVNYAYPLQFLPLIIEGLGARMAYMDIKPATANGKTIMLFHGKNFAGYYWTNVIQNLSKKGYRVIVPDQIGFGKSSRPIISYSFHQLAGFNRQLLDSLGIKKVTILGHSMGGMLATRFALLYPERTEKLMLENPIGLEDYRTFVPYSTPEESYQVELKTSPETIKKYYQSSYFVQWKPEYDELVRMASVITGSPDFPRYAKVAALTSQMIYEQPVVYEFRFLTVPTVLFIGTKDRTIVGKAKLSAEEQKHHGLYYELGKQTAARIPKGELVEFVNCGHIPHLEMPEEFMKALLKNL